MVFISLLFSILIMVPLGLKAQVIGKTKTVLGRPVLIRLPSKAASHFDPLLSRLKLRNQNYWSGHLESSVNQLNRSRRLESADPEFVKTLERLVQLSNLTEGNFQFFKNDQSELIPLIHPSTNRKRLLITEGALELPDSRAHLFTDDLVDALIVDDFVQYLLANEIRDGEIRARSAFACIGKCTQTFQSKVNIWKVALSAPATFVLTKVGEGWAMGVEKSDPLRLLAQLSGLVADPKTTQPTLQFLPYIFESEAGHVEVSRGILPLLSSLTVQSGEPVAKDK